MRLIDVDKLGAGDAVLLKKTGEAGYIVHVFSIHPFTGDVAVLVDERRGLCSVDEVDKVET